MKTKTSNTVSLTDEKQTILNKTYLLQKPIFHILLIIILGLLAYSNTLDVPFHLDDKSNIVDNYKLRDLSNFCTPSGTRWFGFLTFALNYKLHGTNVTSYHIFNLLVHILNAILVYLLVVLTFKTPCFKMSVINVGNKPTQSNLSTFQPFNYLPLFIALLFLSHPIQTQAVTYITQRFASLATMFYLLSLVLYIKARLEVEVKFKFFSTSILTFYFFSLVSAILAMMTKEISFTLPFIIILYEFCFFKFSNHEPQTMNLRKFLYLLPFLFAITIIPLSLIGPELEIYKPEILEMDEGEKIRQLQLRDVTLLPGYEYLLTQFRVIVTYIRLLFLPVSQNVDYDYPIYHSFLEPQVFLSFLFLLLIFACGIYLFYRSRYTDTDNGHGLRLIAFGIFWFFITLSVESSIIPIRDVIFEHRVYLPSIGAVVAFSTAVSCYASRLSVTRYSLPLLLTTIIIILSIATYQRNIVWQDEMSLWKDVVKKSPNKSRGHNNLGNAYNVKGLTDKAIEHYQIALRLKPDNANTHYNIGVLYEKIGLLDEAMEHYHTALRLNPKDEDARKSLIEISQKIRG